MRSLGFCATVPETIHYFQKYKQKLDFATFLEILHQENLKGDPIREIIAGLRANDAKNQGWIAVPEFINILSSVGEKMSHEEIYHVLQQMDISGGRVPFSTIKEFIAKPPANYHYYSDTQNRFNA